MLFILRAMLTVVYNPGSVAQVRQVIGKMPERCSEVFRSCWQQRSECYPAEESWFTGLQTNGTILMTSIISVNVTKTYLAEYSDKCRPGNPNS